MSKAELLAYDKMVRALSTPLVSVRGVGEKTASRLRNKGVSTLWDALSFLPMRYEDRTRIVALSELREGDFAVFRGKLSGLGERGYGRKKTLEATISDGTGYLALKWFKGRFDWIAKNYPAGSTVVGSGVVRSFRGVKEVHHPELEVEGSKASEAHNRVTPVYSEVERVHQKSLRKIMENGIDEAVNHVVELVPEGVRTRNGLMTAPEAYREVHFPSAGGEALARNVARARATLAFEEFFYLQLALLLKRAGEGVEKGICFSPDFSLIKPLLASLPYSITDAQRRVLSEIRKDMESAHPMHRLLQGDVGSGKTLVALLSALMAVESGYQAAIMAPTEILAEQHARSMGSLLKGLPVSVELVTGSMNKGERSDVLGRLALGEVDIAVGTHALIQEGVEFCKLGFAVVDEQHRFGVMQRAELVSKGVRPDLLVMTATPIPRTLTMTVYGDLDVSVIDEMPPGRGSIKTRLVTASKRGEAINFARGELDKGRQVYVVCPLVEDSDKMELTAATTLAERFSEAEFADYEVGLLHGKLKAAEKEAVMARFASREVQVLVCTTVIEVGIDVPNATIMMVEHPERFGLSQLHQLRGRVGRGGHDSHCFLMAGKKLSPEVRERLKVMVDYVDGFKIAEEDLRFRGPGDMLGTRQSGLPDFRIGNILRDGRLLERARGEAARVVKEDPRLERSDLMRRVLKDRWSEKLKLVLAG